MRAKLLTLVALAMAVLATSLAGAEYFGPKLFKTQTGNKSPPTPTRTSDGNHPTHNNDTSHSSLANVNLLLGFGNGSLIWFNNTKVPENYDFYQVTYNVTKGNVQAYYDNVLGSYFVEKILGVGCGMGDFCVSGQYWSLWYWNTASGCWQYSEQGISLLKVSAYNMAAWYYTDTISSFKGRCA